MTVLYLSFYLVLIAMAIWSPRNRRLNAVLLFILAILLSLPAYRSEGPDRDIYTRAYDGVLDIYERSFSMMLGFADTVGLSERGFFWLYSILSISLVLLAIFLFNRHIWWCVLVYYSHWYVLHPMIQIRAACAIGCFLLSIVLWRKWIVSFPLLAGSLFWHSSAGLGILGYTLARIKIVPRWIIVTVVLSVVFCLVGIELSDVITRIPISVIRDGFNKYNSLMDNGLFMEYRALGVWKCVQIALCLVSLRKIDRISRLAGSHFFMNLWCIGLCFGLLVTGYPAMAGRGTEYICTVEIMLVPCIASAFYKDKGWVPLLAYAVATTSVSVIRTGFLSTMTV